ncbi:MULTISPECIES: colicin E5-related ribonuclease [Cyanophyceae]|uniref:colicin E5-related ribonuclease n=1 Tax=Cyanophyceae TaxID=3028117 RepID=UPI001683459B|nr:colicin E5-related ribonuclease [Trichocoleus sp. FACHB-40]MBD2004233.1 hypothetical protein [Trichocoleus sp. FACHB-40]
MTNYTDYQFGSKILQQLSKRGWTKEAVIATIQNPCYTYATRDKRFNPDGTKNNEAATIYYRSDDHYVICNDMSGDIVQVSDTNDPEWIDPFTSQKE